MSYPKSEHHEQHHNIRKICLSRITFIYFIFTPPHISSSLLGCDCTFLIRCGSFKRTQHKAVLERDREMIQSLENDAHIAVVQSRNGWKKKMNCNARWGEVVKHIYTYVYARKDRAEEKTMWQKEDETHYILRRTRNKTIYGRRYEPMEDH